MVPSRLCLSSFSLSVTALAAGNIFCAPVCAQVGTENTLVGMSTAQLEQQSLSLMRRGKRLDTAIGNLTEAVRREPKNAQYALLLACAQAGRAYVLAEAMAESHRTAARIASQKDFVTRWDVAQQDPKNPLYGKPKPEFPVESGSTPRTRDDNKPLILTEDAARAQIRELSESSLSLLKKATTLSTRTDPTVQAESAAISGWTALVLWHLPRKIVPDCWPKKDGKPEGPERIIGYLEQAVTLQPENQSYRLGLADACQMAAVDQGTPFGPPTRFDKALYERGRTLLKEAANRRPNDGALWYRLACMEGQGETLVYGLNPRSSENIEVLRKASVTLSSNALVWYTLSAAHASVQDSERMMTALARGNSSTRLLPIRYKYAAPTLTAWIFGGISCRYPMLDNLIAIGLSRRVNDAKKRADSETAELAVQAVLQMSNKFDAAAKNPYLKGLEQPLFVMSASMASTVAKLADQVP